MRRDSHEEEEEEREQRHTHNDVENGLWERGDRLDVYNAKQRWAHNLVSVHGTQSASQPTLLGGGNAPYSLDHAQRAKQPPRLRRRPATARVKLQ